MKKKSNSNFFSFIDHVFVLTGSTVFVVFVVIIAFNFSKDSRIFANNVGSEVKKPKASPTQKLKDIKIETDQEQNESTGKNTNKSYVKKEQKIRVLVQNGTGMDGLEEKVVSTLINSGYEVTFDNSKIDSIDVTEIIEKNDKHYGSKVNKLLKIGKVKTVINKKSKYDIIIVLGEDFLP